VGGLKKKPSVLYLLGFFGTLTWFREFRDLEELSIGSRIRSPSAAGIHQAVTNCPIIGT